MPWPACVGLSHQAKHECDKCFFLKGMQIEQNIDNWSWLPKSHTIRTDLVVPLSYMTILPSSSAFDSQIVLCIKYFGCCWSAMGHEQEWVALYKRAHNSTVLHFFISSSSSIKQVLLFQTFELFAHPCTQWTFNFCVLITTLQRSSDD